MIRVPVEVRRSFHLMAGREEAFALLRDVPRWARLFPHVEAVDPMPEAGEAAWRWTMEPLGPPGAQVRTVYACRYAFGASGERTLTVTWAPVEGVGNARFSGGVELAGTEGLETDMSFGSLWLDAELEIPAPRFVSALVRAAVEVEFGRMTDRFLERLAKEVRSL